MLDESGRHHRLSSNAQEAAEHTAKITNTVENEGRASGSPGFGTLLRQHRLAAGLSQEALAERAHMSANGIGALERGYRQAPQRETIALLAGALALDDEQRLVFEAHAPRQRGHVSAPKPSLLRIVRSDTRATQRHNLPHRVTSFVGREHEVAEIAALLREHRFVTVVGAGGVGKTRVAVEVASRFLDDFPDGICLVDLAPLTDQTLVPGAVLSALRLPSTALPALNAVVAHLKTRKMLLILDNCEHVIAAAREVAASIVQSSPHAHILATSREALEISGEWVYRLPSLAVPPGSFRSSRDASEYSAIALFIDRARAVDTRFGLTDNNSRDVAEICRRLDGIPLAIELAAARVKALTPRQISRWLDQRFRLLTGGDSRAVPRHQTMTALIDWSYDLLTLREQRFLEALSVFVGGCTLEAATAVCAAEEEDDLDVIDIIASLVTKSMLVAELVGDEQRYHLLETSRQYAREKLIARDEQEQVGRRHARFYVELAEQLETAWETTPE